MGADCRRAGLVLRPGVAPGGKHTGGDGDTRPGGCHVARILPVAVQSVSLWQNLDFLGLGLMGYPMARNLLRAGHEVALWSQHRRQGAAARRRGEGRILRYTPAGGSSMPTASSCASAIPRWRRRSSSGEDGLIEGIRARDGRRGCQHHQPEREPDDRRGLKAKGVDFLDAPCTGSTPGRRGRNPDLHDRRRPGGLRADRSRSSSRWASDCIIAAGRAWDCRPS